MGEMAKLEPDLKRSPLPSQAGPTLRAGIGLRRLAERQRRYTS
jgi:hypothetical protein